MIVMISISPLGTDVSSVDLSQAKLRKKMRKNQANKFLFSFIFLECEIQCVEMPYCSKFYANCI